MVAWFESLTPVVQALLATLFTWGLTALGAGLVFFFKTINRKALNLMLGFAGGVMVAASFWSLLSPAIDLAEEMGSISWLVAAIGFIMGGLFLFLLDRFMPHMHLGAKQAEGSKSSLKRSILLVLSITLHNIPEGLAVGVAFGAVAAGIPGAGLMGAVALAIGIGLQNFPEGAAVSVPLRREGLSRWKSFLYGQASGLVEPISGVLGALLVIAIRPILPYALAFAAGAMIYVVVEELIPEAQCGSPDGSGADRATIGFMIGFALMMMLDVALG
ncbi:MAG: ZIP family metal transporter [Bacilli bacterium]|jgi:ZIP family zinc transporter